MSHHTRNAQKSENYEQYLQYISGLGISAKEKYELLYIVNAIISHFVDQAFGLLPDQMTLQSCGNCFDTSPSHAMLANHPDNRPASAQIDGVEGESNPLGAAAP